VEVVIFGHSMAGYMGELASSIIREQLGKNNIRVEAHLHNSGGIPWGRPAVHQDTHQYRTVGDIFTYPSWFSVRNNDVFILPAVVDSANGLPDYPTDSIHYHSCELPVTSLLDPNRSATEADLQSFRSGVEKGCEIQELVKTLQTNPWLPL